MIALRTVTGSWQGLLGLFTLASFVEVIFWGQISAFTPLYLPHLGIAPSEVPAWTCAIAAISSSIGIPLLPLWGALADRYARQPIIVRSFVAHLLAGLFVVLAGNIWLFVVGRAIQSFALGNSGLMKTTLSERTPQTRVDFAGWMLALTYVPLAVARLYHGSTPGTAVGWVLGAGGLVTLVLSPVLGELSDRVGRWRVLTAGSLLMVVLWPLPALTGDLVSFAAAWAAINGVASAVFALSFSVLSDSIPTTVRGRVMSFAYVPVNLGYAAGPAIGSVVTSVSLFAVFPRRRF